MKRKYRLLFTAKNRGKPVPKGPCQELIAAIVKTKRRIPRFEYRRIADQFAFVFGIEIDKDVVRRVLAKQCRPEPESSGPSWLTFLRHAKDSLCSVDFFRCESLILNSHWVMVVMDQFNWRIIGFAVHAGVRDEPTGCRMLNSIIGTSQGPRYLSADNDPLFVFHRWNANLGILEVTEVKTVPYVPLSYPFVERLLGTIRQGVLDIVPLWNTHDLWRNLASSGNTTTISGLTTFWAVSHPTQYLGRCNRRFQI